MIELVSKRQIMNSIEAMISQVGTDGDYCTAFTLSALVDAERIVEKAEVLAVLKPAEVVCEEMDRD